MFLALASREASASTMPWGSAPCRASTVPAQKAKDSDEKNLAWAKEVCAKHAAGRDAELPWKEMELTTEVARAARICRMANHADYHDLPIYAISVGKSLAFGGFPGEPFNDIGKAVKKSSPFTLTILSCLTNGSRGYFPFSDAYVGGGYESATSPFGPTVADDLIKGEGELMQKFGIQVVPVNLAVVLDKYNKILETKQAELEAETAAMFRELII